MKIDEKGLLNTSDEKGGEKMNTALLSSKSMTWGTPPELFEKLDAGVSLCVRSGSDERDGEVPPVLYAGG